jgi:hypothetical protein
VSHLNNVKAVRITRGAQPQVLDDYPVFSTFYQLFGLFNFSGGIDFKSVQREILAHGKADRFLVVNDQESRYPSLLFTGVVIYAEHSL